MERNHITFISEMDGLPLDGLMIVPDKVRAVLQISHGMCEHKERYVPFMEYMAERGYACVIHDHRGHGKSVRSEEDLGYFYKNGGEYLVEDLHLVTKTMKKQFGDVLYFLLGHSMGSMGVRCYTKKYDAEIDALIVCGSPSKNPMAKFGLLVDKFVQLYRGDRGRSRIVNSVFSDNFQKPFKGENMPNAWICSDKEVVKAYNRNPLCSFTFTLNGYEALLWLSKHTYSEKGWMVRKPSLPIHFISGEQDSCMINRKSFERAVELMKKVGYQKVSSHLYEGMRHEILNEIGKEQVYEDIVEYLDEIIEKNH